MDLVIILICVGIIVIGVGIFFLTGFIFTKKDCVSVVERVGLYVGTFQKTKYFFPLIYRRAGYYRLTPQKLDLKLPNDVTSRLITQIENVLLYHYSGHDIKRQVANIYNSHETVDFNTIKTGLAEIGILLIDISEITENKTN